MNTVTKILLVLLVIMALGAGLVLWKTTLKDHSNGEEASLSEEEIGLILADQRPIQLDGLRENESRRKDLIKSLKQSLAFASEARKLGIAKDPLVKQELKNIATEIMAASYDQKINSTKGPAPPFGFVTEDRVKKFWEGGNWFERFFNSKESGFKDFIDTKISLAKRRGALPEDAQPKEEELKAAKDRYAKIQIVYVDAKAKLKEVKVSTDKKVKEEWARFEKKVGVQVKMQQTDLLARLFSREVLAKKVQATDEDVEKYLAANPKLKDTKAKKANAEKILKEVLADGDFDELAKEHSDDPGSKNRGGLYEGITKGRFAPAFEAAVASLKPGEIYKDLVETDFGFHIIKLVKRGLAKGNDGKAQETYDVRHILIGTMISDPENPNARPVPAAAYARNKLEAEKQKKELERILKENKVKIPEDFKVPAPSKMAEAREEEIKKRMEEQQKRIEEASKNSQSKIPGSVQQLPQGPNAGAPRPQAPQPQAPQPQAPQPVAPKQ